MISGGIFFIFSHSPLTCTHWIVE